MKWDPVFKTVDPPKIVYREANFTEEQKQALAGYRDIKTYHPGFENLPMAPKSQEIWLDHAWRWAGQTTPVQKGACKVVLVDASGILKNADAFCKITHVLDPIRAIKGKYSDQPGGSPENQKAWKTREAKYKDPMNQAYVEALTYFCCSRLREKDLSPHFPHFYGSFCAIADTYKFNITDDFDHYRNMKWFWEGYDKKIFVLTFENAEHETESERAEWTRRPSFLEDDHSDLSSESESSRSGDESVHTDVKSRGGASMHSADDLSFHTGSDSDQTGSEFDLPEPSFFMEVSNFPVMLMYLEKSDGVMDDLLSNHDVCNPGSPEWEAMWAAWLFQIIAALCAAQHTLSLTHNDLHSNNIVYSETDEEFLYYQKRDGTTWKVPTYGKVFRIIDFGRAVFLSLIHI